MSYQAIIARISVRPHPNADRLALGDVLGNQVVIDKDVADGTLGIYFPTDGQLSEEFAAANDLIGRINPETGKHEGGFFAQNRRVRSQSFRGCKSDGFWMPLSSLKWAVEDPIRDVLGEGDQLDTFGSHPICNKYYTPATQRAMGASDKKHMARGETLFFRKQPDISQFRMLASQIPEGSLCYLTEKCHGTSGRTGYVLDDMPRTWWQKVVQEIRECLGLSSIYPDQEWRYLHGSKNVILNDGEYAKGWVDVGHGKSRRRRGRVKPDFYGTNDFRRHAVANLALHKGETIYYELVGWVKPGTPIMPFQPIEDKELKKRYGTTMRFLYSQPDGACKLLVYRITTTSDDGHVTELPWPQVVGRCDQLSLGVVPSLGWFIHQSTEITRSVVELATEGVSTLDLTHIREGVVLRVETPDGRTLFMKNKGHAFGVLEGYIKDNADYVDLEEAS